MVAPMWTDGRRGVWKKWGRLLVGAGRYNNGGRGKTTYAGTP